MSFTQELTSWLSPSKPDAELASPPEIGSKAPSTDKLKFPSSGGKPVVVTFLRHCGCPFAEATFKNLRSRAAKNPDIKFIAISHSNEDSTQKWLAAVGGPVEPPSTSAASHSTPLPDSQKPTEGKNEVEIIVDDERKIYSAWGLGTAGWGHVLSPGGIKAVFDLAYATGIKNRPTESGNRWQTSGSWAVDKEGVVRWGRVAERADEMPDFEDAVKAVEK